MSREYCEAVIYRGKEYDVYWDTITHLVYITKVENPSIHNLNYDNFMAETKDDAQKTALDMLKSVLGRDIL